METRNTMAEITPSGIVNIYTSSQSPFAVKEELNKIYKIPEGNIIVHTPLVGGAFGGKAAIHLEYLAYLASSAVDGRMIRITNTREDDITISPSKIAAEGKLKNRCNKGWCNKSFRNVLTILIVEHMQIQVLVWLNPLPLIAVVHII